MGASPALSVTALLVTHNSAAVIEDALASLPAGVPALVVDNASTDGSVPLAEARGARTLVMPRNIGFGAANNRGLAAVTTPWVLLLNPDARIQPGFLEAMAEAVDHVPGAALLVPAITTDRGSFRKWTSLLTARHVPKALGQGLRSIGFASGGVVLARRDVLAALGGFDEAFFLYFEDDDLSRRVLDAGHAIVLVERARAHHQGNRSTPVTPRITAMKMWHRAWSERYARQKYGLPDLTGWRLVEQRLKLARARWTGDALATAKARGMIAGLKAARAGVAARDIGDRAGEGLA